MMKFNQWVLTGLSFAFACSSLMSPQDALWGPHVAWGQEHEVAPAQEPSKQIATDLTSADPNSQAPSVEGAVDEKFIADVARTPFNVSSQLTQKARASLDKLGDLEYEEVPFSDVKRDLEDSLGVNIVIDDTALVGMAGGEEVVNIRLKNVRYSDGLRLLLNNFNTTYVVQNGIVRIISIDNIYDTCFYSRLTLNLQSTLDLTQTHDNAQQDLASTIKSMVQPHAWHEHGPGLAVLKIISGVMIVQGPEDLISEVKDFIQDLHAQLQAKTL